MWRYIVGLLGILVCFVIGFQFPASSPGPILGLMCFALVFWIEAINTYLDYGKAITLDKLKRKGRVYYIHGVMDYSEKSFPQVMQVQYKYERFCFVKLPQTMLGSVLPKFKGIVGFCITSRYDNVGRVMSGWLVMNLFCDGAERSTIFVSVDKS